MKVVETYQQEDVLVDDEDFSWLSEYTWTVNKHGGSYASRTDRSTGVQKTVLMHREILKAKEGDFVDHINGNRLDNRKENLRICTVAQNAYNARKRKDGISSKYKGVHYVDRYGMFASAIQIERKRHHLGYYENENDAAFYYNVKATEFFGDFAVLNELPVGFAPTEKYKPENPPKRYSKYKGITFQKRDNRYYARLYVNKNKTIHIGSYPTEIEAVIAYNKKSVEMFGSIAKTHDLSGLIKGVDEE